MSVAVRSIARCELCEHRDSHWCQALHHEVRNAVSLVVERSQRHEGKLPAAEVVIDCASWWRLGRGHGD